MTEQDLEELTIKWLEDQGYKHINGSQLERPTREPLLLEQLGQSLAKLNPHLPDSARQDAIKILKSRFSPQADLLDINEDLHGLFLRGVPVEYQQGGKNRSSQAWLIDFQNPEKNHFVVVSQLPITYQEHSRRPDLVLYINGLPLVVIELKNPEEVQATLQKAFNQHQNAKREVPNLYAYNALMVVSDGLDARYGSLSAGWDRFQPWKTPEGHFEDDNSAPQLKTLIKGLLAPNTLLDLIRYFTVFEKTATQDAAGISYTRSIKKVAGYHQYYAVNKAIEKTLQATSEQGDRKAGVIWHTQGSGKSLSMVFYTGKLIPVLDNPTIVVITDRSDLDDQLFNTFSAAHDLFMQKPEQASSRENLRQLLTRASGGVVFSTIQMFLPASDQPIYPLLSDRRNIVVIADEAHRSQYGFQARTVVELDAEGREVGVRTAYGFARYLRDALPNASFLGFTGTPVESQDANTPQVFGDYIDIYDIARAIEDGATVPIFFENRLVEIKLREEVRDTIDEEVEALRKESFSDEMVENLTQRWSRLEAIVGHPERMREIAEDIISHFETRQKAFSGKAMIVSMSRRIAARLYETLVELRPDWHSPDLNKGQIKVVMTSSSADEEELRKHHSSKEDRKRLAERLKDPNDELKLVIVRDMWLTGFDAPCLNTLYVDKPMHGHNLMQAIARVNRVYPDKEGGLIVDYIGIATDLREAMQTYTRSGGKGESTLDHDDAVNLMLEKLDILRGILHGCEYERFFGADLESRLEICNQTSNFLLSEPDRVDRFLRELAHLVKLHALALPAPKAEQICEEVAFFQFIRARLVKLQPQGEKSAAEIEAAIRQLLNKALVSDGVIDIFSAAGMARPDVSILSMEFLDQLREHRYPNLAQKLLEKIMRDEVRERSQRNRIQARKFSERLDATLTKYRNQHITTAQVIEELIQMAKDLRSDDKRGETIGLNDDELAFYDALATSDSAIAIMGDQQLGNLAKELVENVRNNTTVDWQIQQSARAKMRLMVKKLLKKFGYPPDQELTAIDNVIQQSELLSETVSSKDDYQQGFERGLEMGFTIIQNAEGTQNDHLATPAAFSLPGLINTLPFPLASILWHYHRKTQVKDQVEHLYHFFEANALFLSNLLLSGAIQNPGLFRQYQNTWLAGREPGSRQQFSRSEFGLWTTLGSRIANTLREHLQTPTEREEILQSFALPNVAPLNALVHKELWALLNQVREYRNDDIGHTGLNGEEILHGQHQKLLTVLEKMARFLQNAFQQWQLILPGMGEFLGGVYRYEADMLTGPQTQPLNRSVEVSLSLQKSEPCLWHEASLQVLKLLPFVQIFIQDAHYRAYFFNKLQAVASNPEISWVSYHHEIEPKITRDSKVLRELIAYLKSESVVQ
ncbi:MAG: type I restriction endonuclease subunit R [Candidatus Sericytochromatia bacterium]|nr:type I restriction endonuclease subunit R [Candidatus Sericytochromatia bacterium]